MPRIRHFEVWAIPNPTDLGVSRDDKPAAYCQSHDQIDLINEAESLADAADYRRIAGFRKEGEF